MKVEIEFTEPLLGTLSGNKELAEEHIASKHPKEPQEDEIESIANIDTELANGSTVFNSDENGAFLWDYQIKGFFKDACSMLRRVPDTRSKKLTAHRKVIDGLIFPTPRKIHIDLAGKTIFTERPLRAQTAQGERICLARSETAPIGSKIMVDIVCLDKKLDKLVIEWLNYGAVRGLGQWRNSGMGRFKYSIIE